MTDQPPVISTDLQLWALDVPWSVSGQPGGPRAFAVASDEELAGTDQTNTAILLKPFSILLFHLLPLFNLGFKSLVKNEKYKEFINRLQIGMAVKFINARVQ